MSNEMPNFDQVGYPYSYPQPPVSTAVRPGTIVWGLILATLGVLVLLTSIGYAVDIAMVFILLLSAAGMALIASAISSAMRRANRM
ncbi:MAG: hypothetical protein LBB58_06505 [Cellulomonadaceae bacterium]|jgi:uncharacterized protein YhhL (DUF1145 family)|nr:hypothetical protein [Cellulomonadaceae bacterium]